VTIAQRVATVAGTALAYFLLFELNDLLFPSLEFSVGVTWIFLPSGLRLAFILVFGVWGAFGIVVASIVLSAVHHFQGLMLIAVGAGLISGLSPLLARRVCIDFLKLRVDLAGLTAASLLQVALVFAVVSASMHQIWFSFQGLTENFLEAVMVMAMGDLVGTILVLYAAKFLLRFLPSPIHRSNP
jgi:hypothetical protein